MHTRQCPSCRRADGSHDDPWRDDVFDRAADSRVCEVCAGPLADHTTAEHAAKVAERMAALGFPMPVNVDTP